MALKEIKKCAFLLLAFLGSVGLLYANNDPDPSIKFIENKNQWPTSIDFAAKIPGGQFYLQAGRFSYSFIDTRKLEALHEQSHTAYNEVNKTQPFDEIIKGQSIHVNFLKANVNAIPQTFGKLDTYYNYFLGDSSTWASKASSYAGVLYPEFYKGITLKVYSSNVNLKYDYIVAPGADPSLIQVEYTGADQLYLDNGNLYVTTSVSEMTEKRPYAYQFINGKKISVACDYVLKGNKLSFLFPSGFDSCHELVIDPLLIFSTYSGSTADNWGSTATPGEHGNLYSAGVTNLGSGGKFPFTPGVFQTTYGGQYDIGILKYDSLGKKLLYATYLGGLQSESPHSLVVNSQSELVMLGTTSSTNFPTTLGAIDRIFNGGALVNHVVNYALGSDIVVARISPDGSKLLASTFLGGISNDGLNVAGAGLVRNYGDELRGDVITDSDGNIYISSVTSSPDFPLTKGVDTVYNGGLTDAILLKLNTSLTKIIWGTYLGGGGTDAAHTLKLDKHKNIFIAGGTNSNNFPTTVGSFKAVKAGLEDGWIGKINNDGKSILAATFTGTTSYDQVYFLDLNEDEEVYVYGQTQGNFPISNGVFSNPGSGQFVQKFDNQLSVSIFSTVFGSRRGIPDISPTAFLVSECNNLYMSGWGGIVNSEEGFWASDTRNMPISNDAFQKTTSGSDFYFISLTDDASQFLYATYLGGTQSRTHVDGGTSRFDKSGIVYHAVCSGCAAFNATGVATSDFPTTVGAVSRLNRSTNCNNAAFKFDLSVLKARLQTNSMALNMPGFNKVCMPDKIVFQNKCIGGERYQWDFGDGVSITATDTTMIAHQYKAPGRYTVKLKAIDEGTCIGKDSVYTTVDVYKANSKAQENDVICLGTEYALKAYGGASYEWKTKDGLFRSFENSPVIVPEDTTQYFVTITEASGCMRQDTVQINIIPTIELKYEMTTDRDCFSRSSVKITNLTEGRWSNDNIFFDFGDNQTSDADEVMHKYEKDGVYRLKMIGNREFCGSEKTIDVPIFTLNVPNVITPMLEDGNNDKFIIQYGKEGLTPNDYGLKISLVVYNRWGRVVYESNDYQHTWSAEGLAAGVYYYDLTVEDHATCKSWLQVIR